MTPLGSDPVHAYPQINVQPMCTLRIRRVKSDGGRDTIVPNATVSCF
jgi:hypothetical protein